MAVIVETKQSRTGRTEIQTTYHKWDRRWPNQPVCRSASFSQPLVLSRQQARKLASACRNCWPNPVHTEGET